MEVNVNYIAAKTRHVTLPPPSFTVKGISLLPHSDVSLNSIGNGMDSKTVIGKAENDKGELAGLDDALEEINKALEVRNIALNYSIDEKTEDIVITVVERSSKKVIRQIPPEEILKLRGHIKEILGMIYDENV